MTVSQRLNRSFLLISLLTCVVGFFCIWVTRGVTGEFQAVADEILPRIQLLEKMRFAGLRVVSSTSEFAFLQNERVHITGESPPLVVEEDLIDSGRGLFNEAFVHYRTVNVEGHEHENPQLAELLVQFERLEKTSGEIVAAKKQGVVGAAVLALKEKFEAEEMEFLARIDTVIAHKYGELEAGKERVFSEARAAIDSILLFSLVIFVAAVFGGRRIARKITAPLAELCRASNEIGLGRMHTRVSMPRSAAEGDEIKQVFNNFNRMAEELAQAMMFRGHFETISEHLKEGLVITSRQGEILFANQAANDLLGYAKDELRGQPAAVFFRGFLALEEAGKGRKKPKNPNGISSSLPVTKKDGVQVNVSLATFPLYDPGGQPDGQAFFLR